MRSVLAAVAVAVLVGCGANDPVATTEPTAVPTATGAEVESATTTPTTPPEPSPTPTTAPTPTPLPTSIDILVPPVDRLDVYFLTEQAMFDYEIGEPSGLSDVETDGEPTCAAYAEFVTYSDEFTGRTIEYFRDDLARSVTMTVFDAGSESNALQYMAGIRRVGRECGAFQLPGGFDVVTESFPVLGTFDDAVATRFTVASASFDSVMLAVRVDVDILITLATESDRADEMSERLSAHVAALASGG